MAAPDRLHGVAAVADLFPDRGEQRREQAVDEPGTAGCRQVGHGLGIGRVTHEVVLRKLLRPVGRLPQLNHCFTTRVGRQIGQVTRHRAAPGGRDGKAHVCSHGFTDQDQSC